MKIKYNQCDILVPARNQIPCRNSVAYIPHKEGIYDENNVCGKLVIAFVKHQSCDNFLAIPRVLFSCFADGNKFNSSGMFIYSEEDWFPFSAPVPLMFKMDEKRYELRVQPKRQFDFEIE